LLHYHLHNKSRKTNPFLGGTIRNITLWFSWTHWTLKNHKKHVNKYFHKYFSWIHLLGSIDFEVSIISRLLCTLMIVIISFKNSLKNVVLILFLDLFGQEHKFETWFVNFLGNIFLKVISNHFIFNKNLK